MGLVLETGGDGRDLLTYVNQLHVIDDSGQQHVLSHELNILSSKPKMMLHLGRPQNFPHMVVKAFNSNLQHCYYTSKLPASRASQSFLATALDGLHVEIEKVECFILEHPDIPATAVIFENGTMICVGEDLLLSALKYFMILQEWGYAGALYWPWWFQHHLYWYQINSCVLRAE